MRAESPLSEGSDEGKPEDWTNEAAALAAVKSQGRDWGSSSPGPNNSESDLSLNDEDRYRLLGEKRGKAVVGILESDRAKREAAKGKQKVLGVPLWEGDATLMDTDLIIPTLSDHLCGQRALALLKSSIDGGGTYFLEFPQPNSTIIVQISLGRHCCLALGYSPIWTWRTSSFCTSATSVCSETALFRFHLIFSAALSPRRTALTTPAFHALSQIWKRPAVRAPGMPFRAVHSTLVRLGAKQAVMDAMEWVATPDAHPEAIQPNERDDALCRLIRLLTISAQCVPQIIAFNPEF